jgi:hypothetical protein
MHQHDIAASAQQVQRAARLFQQRASGPGVVAALPAALAHIEVALERLATGVVKTAQSVEDWELNSDPALDRDALSPEARALRWHLFHVAARLRGAAEACPDTRNSARLLLREAEVEDEDAADPCSPHPAGMQLQTHGSAGHG